MIAIDAAFVVLRDAGRPLHYREITTQIVERKLWDTEGITPWQTVNARINDDIRSLGSASRFVHAGPGLFGLNPLLAPETPSVEHPRSAEKQEFDRFLVQVNKNIGFANIMNNRRYENDRWMDKSLDRDHGEVKPGDELVIYCTSDVPNYSMSLAFSVVVKTVSSDHVSFELEEPVFFTSALKRARIHELVDEGKLPGVFKNCGHQGFNIERLDSNSAETALGLLNGVTPLRGDEDFLPHSELDDRPDYTIESIIGDGCFLEESRLSAILDRLRVKKNLILQGPPGTGKTWLAKRLAFALIGRRSDRRVRPFQFHPNLSYEDFVRGWRPSANGKLDLVDGPFLKAINDSKDDPSNSYVVVIEEINRGNPAQIFGEMLTLLEADKRSAEEALTLSYQRDPNERVYIPPNLHVIGTMNLADRSLALVDLALRRRFAFFDLEPALNESWRDWVHQQCGIPSDFLTEISQRIGSLNDQIAADLYLGRQFCIGHSFFVPKPGEPIAAPKEWFIQVVETEITPLLGEYWFDRPDKADEAKSQLLSGL